MALNYHEATTTQRAFMRRFDGSLVLLPERTLAGIELDAAKFKGRPTAPFFGFHPKKCRCMSRWQRSRREVQWTFHTIHTREEWMPADVKDVLLQTKVTSKTALLGA